MIKYGVIGTNWITDEFIKGANEVGGLSLNSVYSRDIERAKDFGNKYNLTNTFDDLEKMAESSLIDAVYIANPNSLHYRTAKLFLKNKKHVFVEKPITLNRREMEDLSYLSQKNNKVLLEGIRNMYTPNMQSIMDNIYKLGKVRRYIGVFSKISSRYDLLKEGKTPNVFNPEFSGGSLMDLGVYPTHPMVKMFGMPNNISSKEVKLWTGTDGMGIISFDYGDMDGLIIHSKITDTYMKSKIQGEDGTMVIDKISDPEDIKIIYRDGKTEDISRTTSKNKMYHEALEFKNLICEGKYESDIVTHRDSINVLKVLDKILEKSET